MEITAHARYMRMSPRRIRLVADAIRGLSVANAEQQLFGITRRATLPLKKLLASAVANAEQNFDCMRENLYVKTIIVNEAPMLKRFTPRAFGRATSIRKRSAHMTIVVAEREEGKRGGRARRDATRSERVRATGKSAHTHAPHEEKNTAHPSTSDHHTKTSPAGMLGSRHHVEGAKENVRDRGKSKGFLKRLFNRKSGTG